MKNKLFYVLSIVILVFSCSKRITLDLPDYSSKLVVNGEFDTESDFAVQVSRSLPIMQSNDSTGYLIKSAVVTIYEDGTLLDTAKYFNGQFILNQKPKAGKSYSVIVTSGNYTPVHAEITMPNTLVITSSYKDSIGLDAHNFKIGQLSLSFTDQANVKNYYKLLIRAHSNTWIPFAFASNDILFLNNEKLNDGSYLFSDRTFAGRTKTLDFIVPSGTFTGSPKFEVSIKSFSEDYFNYLRQTDNYDQNGNGFSNDPIILKTNVINGLGMIGGVSNARDTLF